MHACRKHTRNQPAGSFGLSWNHTITRSPSTFVTRPAVGGLTIRRTESMIFLNRRRRNRWHVIPCFRCKVVRTARKRHVRSNGLYDLRNDRGWRFDLLIATVSTLRSTTLKLTFHLAFPNRLDPKTTGKSGSVGRIDGRLLLDFPAYRVSFRARFLEREILAEWISFLAGLRTELS
jgi:hypothetical protein